MIVEALCACGRLLTVVIEQDIEPIQITVEPCEDCIAEAKKIGSPY